MSVSDSCGYAVGPAGKRSIAKETVVTVVNELSVAGHAQTLRQLPPEAVTQRLAWAEIHLKDGWISFRGQTLESVVAEFNRFNGRQLLIGCPATGQIRVGGVFRVTDVDGFIAALGVTHGIKAVGSPVPGQESAAITLSGGGSGSVHPESPWEDPTTPVP